MVALLPPIPYHYITIDVILWKNQCRYHIRDGAFQDLSLVLCGLFNKTAKNPVTMTTSLPNPSRLQHTHSPSPYSLSLTALILLHCQAPEKGEEEQEEESVLYHGLSAAAPSHVQNVLQQILLPSPNSSGSHGTNKNVLTLVQLIRGNDQSSDFDVVADRFLHWLNGACAASLDAVVDFSHLVRHACTAAFIDNTSLTGTVVYDTALGLEKMSSLAQTARLWKAWHAEVQQAQTAIMRGTSKTEETPWRPHLDQMEDSLRNMLNGPGGIDGMVQALFQDDSPSMPVTTGRNLPSFHFMKFLKSVRQGERVESIDQLHSYFDKALIHSHAKSKNSEQTKTQQHHILQFAPILLSALHCQNGNADISRLATQEAAQVSQNSQDTASVAFALGWLYENNQDNPHDATNILKRCARRAAEGNRPNLVTGAELLLAREALTTEDPRPAWIHLSNATAATATDAATADRPTRLDDHALPALQRHRIIATAVWDRWGQSTLAALSSLASLPVSFHNNSTTCVDDAPPAILNLARQALLGLPSALVGVAGPKRAIDECVFETAIHTILDWSHRLRISDNEQLKRHLHLLQHEWAVRRGDYQEAATLLRGLRSSIQSPIALARQIQLQEALLYAHRGEVDRAKALLRDGPGDQVYTQLQQAILHLEASPEYVASGLTLILGCLSLCEDRQLAGLQGSALTVLGGYFLALQEPELALSTLRVALPSLLQKEHVWFQGHAFLTTAKCHLALCKNVADKRRKRRAALKYLGRAERILQACQDAKGLREIYYLQARLFDEEQAQKDAARKFVTVSRHLSSHSVTDVRSSRTQEYLQSMRFFPQTVP